jgi:hypothetical protein
MIGCSGMKKNKISKEKSQTKVCNGKKYASQIMPLFRSINFLDFDTVALSFLFDDKHCPIIE